MNTENKIQVLIIEDHAVVRAGLRQLLEDVAEVQVIGDVERGEEGVRIVEEQAPDVVLLDLVLETSQLTGLETLERITSASPSTRVVVLSAYPDDELVFPALHAGALGYMLKRALPEEVIEAVRDAARGRYHVDPLLIKKIVDCLPGNGQDQPDHWRADELTARERELVPYLVRGMTNVEIGRELNISPSTVKTHVSNILHKLGVSERGKIPFRLAQKDTPMPAQPTAHPTA